MADRELEQILLDILGQAPLSPAFLAGRDRLEQAATAASARLTAAVNRMAILGADRDSQTEVARRLAELQALGDLLAATAPQAAPGGWRKLFVRRKPDPASQRAATRERFVASVIELASSRDAMLHQLVAIDRAKAMLAEACGGLERARAWLGQAQTRIETAMLGADSARAQALAREVLPTLVERQSALAVELALGSQAHMALIALHENSQALVDAIDNAARAARSVESSNREIDRADRRMRESEREIARLTEAMEGVAAATGRANPNLIDPDMASQDGRALDQVGRALANVRQALGALDSERERLVGAAHSIAQSQSDDRR